MRLLQIELNKLRYNKAAKVLTIIYFSLFLSIVLFASIHFKIGPIDFQLADQGIFNFPLIWHFNAYFAAILKIFLGVVIIAMMAAEYSNRTLKQNLIDGLSKKEFVLSKVYTVLMFSVVSTLFLFLVSLILGLIFSSYTEVGIIFSGMQYLGGYFLKLVAFFSFCFFLTVLVKRAAFSIGALFIWWIVENIISGVVLVTTKSREMMNQVAQFLPLESMSNLIKEPFRRLGIVQLSAQSAGVSLDPDYYLIHWSEVIIVLVWTLIFFYAAYALIKKRDL